MRLREQLRWAWAAFWTRRDAQKTVPPRVQQIANKQIEAEKATDAAMGAHDWQGALRCLDIERLWAGRWCEAINDWVWRDAMEAAQQSQWCLPQKFPPQKDDLYCTWAENEHGRKHRIILRYCRNNGGWEAQEHWKVLAWALLPAPPEVYTS